MKLRPKKERTITVDTQKIASIIDNWLLAPDIHRSISSALTCTFACLVDGKTVWDMFEQSLKAARDNVSALTNCSKHSSEGGCVKDRMVLET